MLIKKADPDCSLGRTTLSSIENAGCIDISFNLLANLCRKEIFDCDMGYLLCEYDEKQHIAADVKEAT